MCSRLFAFLLACLLAAPALAVDNAQPKITRLKGKVVTVTVPAGFDSVSLQNIRVIKRSKTRTERVWGTMDTQFPNAQETTLTFRLTRLIPRKNLRVIGSRSSPLPENFLSGVTSFGGDSLSLESSSTGNSSVVAGRVNSGSITLSNTASGFTTNGAGVGDITTTGGSTATVVESDIWKIDGDRLYFFNQLRGLQVIDVGQPDVPVLLGTLRMPAAGEDLYVLDHDHVALLKRANNWWGPVIFLSRPGLISRGVFLSDTAVTLSVAGTASSNALTLTGVALSTTLRPYSDAERTNELVIADVKAGAPQQIASVPFKGSLIESRLVGKVLYVATSTSRVTDIAGTEYGTMVTAFDVADPAHPTERDSVFVPGWSAMVTATSDYFVVTGGYPSTLQLVDISAGDGTLRLAGSVAPDGYVQDKFKINIERGVLTVLSQVSRAIDNWSWGPATSLQTFSLADPDAPAPLGQITIAPGETLRATRFDEGRVYVVTFEQIDPLHIVDLRDPARPVVTGEVEAPGFSTYIEPLGDRLVTIGLVDWKPAVSLFDVSDPAAPKLLQQLTLGGKNDGWSHSEAVWNEKAFKVLADQNLILLPVSGTDLNGTDDWGGEWFSRVQLIDLFRDSIVPRGKIDAAFSPRRADVVNDRIAAISPSKLVIVNADNRDKPKVTAELELAWSVNRVFRTGDYLVQIGSSADYTGKPAPTLSVSPANAPDETLDLVDLDPLDVVGSTLRDGTLYLAQRAWPRWWINDAAEDKPQLLVTAYDVSALPKLKKLSQSSGPAPVDSWGNLTPLWPSPGTLVWAAEGQYLSLQPILHTTAVIQLDVAASLYRPWWGAWTKQFISFNVGNPAKIAYGSTVELKPSNATQFSAPFAQAGLVFVSEQQVWDHTPDDNVDDTGRHFLRVVDYTSPSVPYIRDERVNIPGRLAGVAREGKLLYTVGCDIDPITRVATNTAALHASAFDGVAAHLIATQPLPSVWSPIAFAGPSVVVLEEQPAYVWKPYQADPVPAKEDVLAATSLRLSYWWWGSYVENPLHSELRISQLTDAGFFIQLGALELAHDSGLHLFGDLAVTKPDYYAVRAIDLSNTLAPADLGAFSLPGNIWPNLDGAAGALGVGLWLPTGSYGVETIGLAE